MSLTYLELYNYFEVTYIVPVEFRPPPHMKRFFLPVPIVVMVLAPLQYHYQSTISFDFGP